MLRRTSTLHDLVSSVSGALQFLDLILLLRHRFGKLILSRRSHFSMLSWEEREQETPNRFLSSSSSSSDDDDDDNGTAAAAATSSGINARRLSSLGWPVLLAVASFAAHGRDAQVKLPMCVVSCGDSMERRLVLSEVARQQKLMQQQVAAASSRKERRRLLQLEQESAPRCVSFCCSERVSIDTGSPLGVRLTSSVHEASTEEMLLAAFAGVTPSPRAALGWTEEVAIDRSPDGPNWRGVCRDVDGNVVVDLSYTQLSGSILFHLLPLSLARLSLPLCSLKLEPLFLQQLTFLPKLAVLSLGFNVGDEAVPRFDLPLPRRLRRLSLAGSRFCGETDLTQLAATAPALEVLDLRGNPAMTVRGLHQLSGNLTELYLSGTRVELPERMLHRPDVFSV